MTFVEFSADTNNRSVNRSDGYNPEIHESKTHEALMRLAVDSNEPLPEAADLGGTNFDRPADYGPDDTRPKRRRNPQKEAIGRYLQDMKTSGHGWTVEQFRDDTKDIPPCPYCDGPMYQVESWYCECTLEVFTEATWQGCRCNWCTINREGFQPTAGRPRSHCGKPECKKRHRKAENRRAYQRRKAKAVSA